VVKPQFKKAGIHPILVDNIQLCGYETPTPIQAYTIPAVITGHDMIGVAQTGSFKIHSSSWMVLTSTQALGRLQLS
jgi:ATP-dependent RNA helicase DDX3X